jgi:hypothetical protein
MKFYDLPLKTIFVFDIDGLRGKWYTKSSRTTCQFVYKDFSMDFHSYDVLNLVGAKVTVIKRFKRHRHRRHG